ncbi:MAG: efflux RND transporter periplasmic adaptor subunit [Mailhella sp.]
MKRIILFLIVALFSAAGWFFYRGTLIENTQGQLKLYGNIEIRQISLAFEKGGRIKELFAEEGDRVKEGQILARVDVTGFELEADRLRAEIAVQGYNLQKMKNGSRPEEISRAEAVLRTAEASLTQARRNESRMARLRMGNSVSDQERENAQTSLRMAEGQRDEALHSLALLKAGYRPEDISMAEAQLHSARAALAIMQHNIEVGTLYAPSDAVVRSRLMEAGDMASSSAPVFLLSLTSPKWVRTYATEPQLGRIRYGMPAEIHTDSSPEAISGRVGYIASTAEFTPKSVQTEELRPSLLYEVRIVADDRHDRLRIGMPVSVIVHEGEDGSRNAD